MKTRYDNLVFDVLSGSSEIVTPAGVRTITALRATGTSHPTSRLIFGVLVPCALNSHYTAPLITLTKNNRLRTNVPLIWLSFLPHKILVLHKWTPFGRRTWAFRWSLCHLHYTVSSGSSWLLIQMLGSAQRIATRSHFSIGKITLSVGAWRATRRKGVRSARKQVMTVRVHPIILSECWMFRDAEHDVLLLFIISSQMYALQCADWMAINASCSQG